MNVQTYALLNSPFNFYTLTLPLAEIPTGANDEYYYFYDWSNGAIYDRNALAINYHFMLPDYYPVTGVIYNLTLTNTVKDIPTLFDAFTLFTVERNENTTDDYKFYLYAFSNAPDNKLPATPATGTASNHDSLFCTFFHHFSFNSRNGSSIYIEPIEYFTGQELFSIPNSDVENLDYSFSLNNYVISLDYGHWDFVIVTEDSESNFNSFDIVVNWTIEYIPDNGVGAKTITGSYNANIYSTVAYESLDFEIGNGVNQIPHSAIGVLALSCTFTSSNNYVIKSVLNKYHSRIGSSRDTVALTLFYSPTYFSPDNDRYLIYRQSDNSVPLTVNFRIETTNVPSYTLFGQDQFGVSIPITIVGNIGSIVIPAGSSHVTIYDVITGTLVPRFVKLVLDSLSDGGQIHREYYEAQLGIYIEL